MKRQPLRFFLFSLGFFGLSLLTVTMASVYRAGHVLAAASTYTQTWCATEAFVGVANNVWDGTWERFVRSNTVILGIPCGGGQALHFDGTVPRAGLAMPEDFNGGGGDLDGSDQVINGNESNYGFVTSWAMHGTITGG